jgi:hypothetical protein
MSTFAVNVYHRFDEITDEWNIHEVRVNSTLLHTALEKILEDSARNEVILAAISSVHPSMGSDA